MFKDTTSRSLALLAGLCLSGTAEAQFHIGVKDYATLSAAIAGAGTGDTILIDNGTWNYSGNYGLTIPTYKTLTIRSKSGDRSSCIIQCTGGGTDRFLTIRSGNTGTSLRDLTIRDGNATTGGGAIRIEDDVSGVWIDNVVFLSNSSSNRGGAVVVHPTSDVIFNECLFISNSASYGGALAFGSSNAVISKCTFSNNEADIGGAIYAWQWTGEAKPSIGMGEALFTNNHAEWSGGAIYAVEAKVRVNSSRFYTSTAKVFGGAIAAWDTDLEVYESLMADNKCIDTVSGSGQAGALYLDGGVLDCINVEFRKNKSDGTTAVRLVGVGKALFGNCEFLRNEGGATMSLWESTDALMINALFTDNEGKGSGGVYVAESSHLELQSSTMVDNVSHFSKGAGVYVSLGASAEIGNSIFWENNASGSMSSEAQLGGLGWIELDSTCVQNLDMKKYDGGTNNEKVDPKFEDPSAGDYHLAFGSPYVNEGDNLLLPSGVTVDLDSTARIKHKIIDLGAYETARHPADFNDDGVLDIFDFLQFQDLFVRGDPLADLNGDGVFDIFDFLVFQNLFTS